MKTRLEKLKQIYQLYGRFIEKWDVACTRGCASCCTSNVTLSSLEGMLLVDGMPEDARMRWKRALTDRRPPVRFRPATTTNRIPEHCLRGESFPEEEMPRTGGTCPLLSESCCPVYTVRPFGCRCMVSRRNCGTTGSADVDPYVLTVNHLFLQVIEHVDAAGFTGNLSDVLIFLLNEERQRDYAAGDVTPADHGFVSNRPIPVLMVPPEHRHRIRPLYAALRAVVES